MSDDGSDNSSGSEDAEPVETLVSGRAKRATAGNRLSYLLQHLDDEEIKADVLADDETDQIDYSASGDEDGDVDLESSDDDEDQGPPKEGDDQADLEGEKELQKQERAESKKKRKARELVKIQPLRKKVKIVETPTTIDGETEPAPVVPRKRIESVDHGPSRHSRRTQTVENARSTEAKLIESQKRAQKTQESMRLAADRKAARAGPVLTQADRMARALKIEKQNARSLNRWEESEQERLQIQKEKLEAMRNRKLEGPVIRYWSGAVTWQWREGPDGPVYVKLKYKPRPKVEEVDEVAEKKKPERSEITESKKDNPPPDGQNGEQPSDKMDLDKPAEFQTAVSNVDKESTIMTTATQASQGDHNNVDVSMADVTEVPPQQEAPQDTVNTAPVSEANPPATDTQAAQAPPAAPSFLDGIDIYAAQSEDQSTQQVTQDSSAQQQPAPTLALHYIPSMPPYQHIPAHLANDPHHITAASLPLMRERAARTLLILESFPDLDTPYPAPSRRSSTSVPSTALTSILLPESHPDLTPAELKYLTTKHKRETAKEREDLLPPAPARPICHITGKTARFRDPKTGLAYRDMVAYKAIQRVLANGCQWSALLDVWSGIVGEGSLGRVAKGVPEGFWTGKVSAKSEGEVIVVD
ncbi:hypothetical protein MBLNU457_4813t1 [Dothideomycetes sp. NU457]